MFSVELSTFDISPIIWRRWAHEFSWDLQDRITNLATIGRDLESDIAKMSVNAGSISVGTAKSLYLVSRKVSPKTYSRLGLL